MIKCKKCKRITKKNVPTGLIKEYRTWIDKSRTERRDILEISKVCFGCSQSLNNTKVVQNES